MLLGCMVVLGFSCCLWGFKSIFGCRTVEDGAFGVSGPGFQDLRFEASKIPLVKAIGGSFFLQGFGLSRFDLGPIGLVKGRRV